jgi:hypothetical protein
MKRLNWTSVAIMIGLPGLLGFVAWLIYILSSPERWCGVQVTGTKMASRPIADCSAIVLQLIHWLGWYGVTLIGCICIAFLTIVARDLRAYLDVSGPNGWGAKVGGDNAASGAAAVADAAVEKAADIAEAPPPPPANRG